MSGFKHLSIVYTLVMFLPCGVGAQEVVSSKPPARPLGSSWPVIVDSLKSKGISRIGDFDLTKFSQDAKAIVWIKNSALPPAIVAGNRHSAYFETDGKKVFISQSLPSDEGTSMPNLELHEALGALGYDDHSYTYSSALNALSTISQPAQQKALAAVYGQSIFKNLAMSGGGNSVSGGGDLSALFVKNQVLLDLMHSGKTVSWNFLIDYPSIDFEPVYLTDVDFVAMKYEFKTPSAIAAYGPIAGAQLQNRFGQTYEDQITIFVPMSRWSRVAERPAVMREIETNVLSIYPTNDSDATVEYTPQYCKSNIEVEFPPTSDGNIRTIQDFRAGFIRGCDPSTTNFTILNPTLPAGAEPEDVGYFYFNCRVGVPPQTRDSILKTPRGKRTILSVDASPDDETSVLGRLIPNGTTGEVVAVDLVFRKAANLPLQSVASSSQNGENASVQTKLDGKQVALSCSRKSIGN